MTIRNLTVDEMAAVHGGRLLKKVVDGCWAGAGAGLAAAKDGYGALGAGAGCLAGASAAMAGGGEKAQAAAGFLAGAGFGPRGGIYAGSSNDPSAANYENQMDRKSSRWMPMVR